jgi:transposase, IS5 family
LARKPYEFGVKVSCFRGVDEACAPVHIIQRGKFKSLDKQQRRWLKRRSAEERARWRINRVSGRSLRYAGNAESLRA